MLRYPGSDCLIDAKKDSYQPSEISNKEQKFERMQTRKLENEKVQRSKKNILPFNMVN